MDNTEAHKKSPKQLSNSPDEHENRMIALTMNEVENRIRNHTATSQELTHFLKLGTSRELLEKQKLEEEIRLLKAKQEALKAQKKYEDLIENALKAMKKYSGQSDDEEYEYVDD